MPMSTIGSGAPSPASAPAPSAAPPGYDELAALAMSSATHNSAACDHSDAPTAEAVIFGRNGGGTAGIAIAVKTDGRTDGRTQSAAATANAAARSTANATGAKSKSDGTTDTSIKTDTKIKANIGTTAGAGAWTTASPGFVGISTVVGGQKSSAAVGPSTRGTTAHVGTAVGRGQKTLLSAASPSFAKDPLKTSRSESLYRMFQQQARDGPGGAGMPSSSTGAVDSNSNSNSGFNSKFDSNSKKKEQKKKKPIVLTPYHLPSTTAVAASAAAFGRTSSSSSSSPIMANLSYTSTDTDNHVGGSYTPTAKNVGAYGDTYDGMDNAGSPGRQWSLLGQQKEREERERRQLHQMKERQMHHQQQLQQQSRGGYATPNDPEELRRRIVASRRSGGGGGGSASATASATNTNANANANTSSGNNNRNNNRNNGNNGNFRRGSFAGAVTGANGNANGRGGRNVSGGTSGRSNNNSANNGANNGSGTTSSHNNAPSSSAAAASSSAATDQQTANRHKYKTELCSNYMKTGHCRFGDFCKFAHGYDELRQLTVRTLLANGVADAAYHCVRPCFVHIATGHCPFGVRCTCLHDPRVDDVTDRVLRAARGNGTGAGTGPLGQGLGQAHLTCAPCALHECYTCDAEEVEVEVQAAAASWNGWQKANRRSRALPQAAANNGGGFHPRGVGSTGQTGGSADGNYSVTPGSLVGRVLQLGSAAGIDLARADDPDRHWLDHYEHPVPGIATDLIVAHLHNHFVNGVNYNNPFGAILGPVVETVASKLRRPGDGSRDLHADYLDSVWSEFFDAVVAGKDLTTVKLTTEEDVILQELSGGIRSKDPAGLNSPASVAALNTDGFPLGMEDRSRPPHLRRKASADTGKYDCEPCGIDLTELERLKIVIKMCYTPKATWHKYSSTHTVLGQEAMIVQSRIFVLSGDGSVEEYLGTTAALNAGHHKPDGDVVRVHEIAYGSDGSAKAKAPTALYFDIPLDCIARKNSMSPGRSTTVSMDSYIEAARTKPFYITRPYDQDALALVVGSLKLRIRELELPGKLDRIRQRGFLDRLEVDVGNATFEEVQTLYAAKMGLGSQFQCLVSHYATIYWDRCAERADKNSSLDKPVLNVESNYTTQRHEAGTSGAIADTLWNTFVTESGRLFQGDPRGGGRSSQVFAHQSNSAGPIPFLKRAEDGTQWYEEADNATRCWRDVLFSCEGEGEWEYARQAVLGYKEQNPTARPDSRASARSSRYAPSPAFGSSDQSQSLMFSDCGVGTPYGSAQPPRAASSGVGSYSMYSSNMSRRPSFSDCYGSATTKKNNKFSGTPMTRNVSIAATPDASYAVRSRSRAYAASTPSQAYAYGFRRSPPVQEDYHYGQEEAGYFY